MSKATLESIKKNQILYYTKATDSSCIHKVRVDDITEDHYKIRFTKQLVYDVKKHKRSITHYYHTLDAAIKACEEKVKVTYKRELEFLESKHIENLNMAGSNIVCWDEVTKGKLTI